MKALPWIHASIFLLLLLLAGMLSLFFLGSRETAVVPLAPSTLQVPFSLTNQSGRIVTGTSLEGRTWAANVFFTRCPSICAQMTLRMKELQEALGGRELLLVSLTTDPGHDTPEVLERYADRFGADTSGWHFLTGPAGTIRNVLRHRLLLSAEENPEQSRQSEMDLYTHSTQVVLMDGSGSLAGIYEALSTNFVEQVLADLDRL